MCGVRAIRFEPHYWPQGGSLLAKNEANTSWANDGMMVVKHALLTLQQLGKLGLRDMFSALQHIHHTQLMPVYGMDGRVGSYI